MKELNEVELREVEGGFFAAWWGSLTTFQKGVVIGGGIFGAGVVAGFVYELSSC